MQASFQKQLVFSEQDQRHFNRNMRQIVRIQSFIKGCVVRKQIAQQLAQMEEENQNQEMLEQQLATG